VPDSTGSMAEPTELKVLVVIDALGEGGTERSMADLARALRPIGIELVFATLKTRGAEGVELGLREDGFDVRLLPAGRRRIPTFRALIRDVRPDVVHSMLFEANLVARVGTVGLGVPLMTSLVNISYSDERLATAGTDRRKLRVVQAIDAVSGRLFVDHYHAVSDAAREDARRHLGVRDQRVSVVPRGRPDPAASGGRSLGPDVRAAVRHELGIPGDATVVVNVGRHEHQKDHPTLVRAMAPLLVSRPDLWLLIAGREGSETLELRRVLDDAVGPADGEARRRVVLLGHRGDVSSVLAASDLFVLTSRYEGLPGALIEAMAAGLPAVASDIGPVREVVTGESALLVPAGDAAAFTTAISSILDDPARSRAMGATGRGQFERSFRIDVCADAMAELYRRVARRAASGA
jgi:glycosyltransferase involved in cell wall biosynthesis